MKLKKRRLYMLALAIVICGSVALGGCASGGKTESGEEALKKRIHPGKKHYPKKRIHPGKKARRKEITLGNSPCRISKGRRIRRRCLLIMI